MVSIPQKHSHYLADILAEWKGRDDGLVAHVFFRNGPNFSLSVFAFAVEGWIFYSAVNSITPLVVLNLGFQTSAWKISIRQLSYTMLTLFTSIPITYVGANLLLKQLLTSSQALCHVEERSEDSTSNHIYLFLGGVSTTRSDGEDLPNILSTICYANIKPSMNHAQLVFNILCKYIIGKSPTPTNLNSWYRSERTPDPSRRPRPIHITSRLPLHRDRACFLRQSSRWSFRICSLGYHHQQQARLNLRSCRFWSCHQRRTSELLGSCSTCSFLVWNRFFDHPGNFASHFGSSDIR